MLTKEYIKNLKTNGSRAIECLVKDYQGSRYLIFILANLGQLPKDFDGSFLKDFLIHENPIVRFWTVKTMGKLNRKGYLPVLKDTAFNDNDTKVRREAVSSIGRMRTLEGQEILTQILQDKCPQIICQAVRGLLVFKGDKKIDECLKMLVNHENEMVRTIVYKAYFTEKKDKNAQSHVKSYDYLKNVIVNADTIDVMELLQDESIHLTFTSPPYYNARDYSIYPSYETYLAFLVKVFKEIHRITKEGRFLIINTSPIIIPRISRSHSSKRYPIPFDMHPYLVAIGWEFIDDIIWLKPEASVKNRIGGFQQHRKPLGYKPNSVTEYLMVYRKNTEKLLDWNIRQYDFTIVQNSKIIDGFETTNVWKIDPCFDKVHSAVFPAELCKRVIQYYSYKGDLVFDPFGGSGTTGKVAKNLGRYFLMTEKDERYFNYMQSKKKFDIFETKFLTLKEFQKTIK